MKSSFSKDAENLLVGLGAGSARRGKTVLRLIYARVADCVKSHSHNPGNLYQSETLRDTRNLAYLGAIATGAQSTEPPSCTIQDLEKYASEWADIVPHSPAIQADLAKRLSDSFSFEARHVPGIISALHLNDPKTAKEFRNQNNVELNSIFTASTPISQSVKWHLTRAAVWVDNLPAFWASFALTITSTLGPSVLVLPIVFISFPPIFAAMIVLAIGLLNTLTLAFLAESQLRGRPVLRHLGFNQMIGHYLDSVALKYLKLCLFLYCMVILFAFTGGFLEAIASTIGTGGFVWFIALYLFVFWYVSPGNNTGSLVSAFIIALTNLAIIAGFTVLILWGDLTTSPELLTVSATSEFTFKSTPILMAVGATLYCFAGHISVSNSAQLVLNSKNSGKGFLRGAVVGLGTTSAIFALWVFATISAFHSGLLPHANSVLQSISLHFGPWASAVSVVFIVLSLGIGSGNYAMAAHHIMVDKFTRRRKRPSIVRTSDGANGGTSIAWSHENLTAKLIITSVMVAALVAYTLGVVDLNKYFALIGGLMAPIIAGVFPILIFTASRQRGAFTEYRVFSFLSAKFVLFLSTAAFASVYVCQSITVEHAMWYRGLSIGLFFSLIWLVVHLIRKGTFKAGGVILIDKGADGWDPKTWQVFEGGREISDRRLMWKTAVNGEFQAISSTTNPVRVLSAVRLDKNKRKGIRFDVVVMDNTARSPVEFTVNESNPALLEIVIGK